MPESFDMTSGLLAFGLAFPPGCGDWRVMVTYREDSDTRPSEFGEGFYNVGAIAAYERGAWRYIRAVVQVRDRAESGVDGRGQLLAESVADGLELHHGGVGNYREPVELEQAVQEAVFAAVQVHELS